MCHTWRAKDGWGKAKFDDGRQQGRGRVSETRGVENPSDGTGWAGSELASGAAVGWKEREEGETATTQVDL
jgi:hypothetical protein